MSIQIESLSYTYMTGTPLSHTALHDVSLTISEGSFTAIAGETGAGKSTLMQLIGGLIQPTAGCVLVDGVPLYGGRSAKEKEAARAARFRVGMVFQYPEHQLFEETIGADIAFGPRNQGLTEPEVEKRVREAMELVHLPAHYRERSPFALSGGERRRAAIAGVLALTPRYLVLDEPAAGLDPRGREELLKMLTMLHRERGVSIVLVSHSMEDILRVATHLVILADGRIIGAGEPRVLFRREELLARASLIAPHILRLGKRLAGIGYPVENCLCVEDMAAGILAAK
ncbi:energy-coupling factor transporter ATPase [uncultured Selenomonas sp.]|uniref:energy-coupling factor transporter ATPase n=1 Tax=uncultured Selenomonas sp. TaxID=159275 RepID=UPI0028D50FCF|nr:energy-coupling factor transporter ATPase [uncultured Selenomonas sp.]